MQSLKELRAQNAARAAERLGDVAATTSDVIGLASSPLAIPVSSVGLGSRPARTLAPLSSTRSIRPVARGAQGDSGHEGGGGDSPTAGGSGQVDIETNRPEDTSKRRRRRKKDSDQRDDESVDNGPSVNAPTVATERTSAVEGNNHVKDEGNVDSGRRGKATNANALQHSLDQPAGADGTLPSDGDTGGDEDSIASDELPLSARRAPPQEKPKKKLTPLAARRARMEQQKRQETERKIESPQQLSDVRREERNMDSRDKKDSDDSDPAGSRDAARRGAAFARAHGPAANSDKVGSSTAVQNQEEPLSPASPGGSTEEDRLIDPTQEDDEGKKAGQSIDDGVEGDPAEAIASPTETEDDVEEEGVEDLGDARIAVAESRLSGMRHRMKKASQGRILKAPSSPTFRRSTAENGGKTGRNARGWGGGRFQRKGTSDPANAGVGPAVSKGNDDVGQGGTSDGDRMGDSTLSGGGRSGREQDGRGNSESTSNESGMSPAAGKVERVETSDSDNSGSSGSRQRKVWQNTTSSAAEKMPATDKEVTLGHVVDRKMREMGYIRKPAVDDLKNRRSLRERVAAERAPEVHFIGEISGAQGFGTGVSCRFRVEGGRHWTCLSGLEEGQTQVVYVDSGESFAAWNHPLDLHYTTKSVQGWPRVMVQVWQLDMHGRNVLRGYGFRHLPSTTGFSEVSVPCWRPTGTMQEETAAFFLGVTPRLTAEDAVFNRAWDQRCRLVTLPAGTVWIQMNGLSRNLHDQDVNSLPFS